MNAIQTLLTDQIAIWTDADNEKKTGRGRSSGNAASVYGIQKLRELILLLAVRGKLLPQDPHDEPASELLMRIAATKARLIAEGRIKEGKMLPAISKEEITCELPQSWEWSRIADLTAVINGRAYAKQELLDSGTPVLRVGNLFTSNDWYYSNLELEEDKYCDAGDLIFSWSASFGPFIWTGPKVIYHYHIWKLNLHSEADLNKNYFYKFLLEKTQEMKASGHGVSMIHMTKEAMEKMVVPVPPLAEQHRIVAKVDELMALCDQLETRHNNAAEAHEKLVSHLLATLTQSQNSEDFSANWQRIAAHFDTLFSSEASIDALKQTLLQLAVMGKLVSQDPNDEPASALLKRIQAEKTRLIAEGKIKKDKLLGSITDEEKPFELPQGWEWTRTIDCSVLITDGEHATPQRTPGGLIPLVTAKNVRDGYMDYDDTDFVEVAVAEKCWRRCKPDKGDIMMVSVGATLGRLTVIDEQKDMVIVRSVTLIRPCLTNADYFALALKSPLMQQTIWGNIKQMAQPGIYLAQSSSMSLPFPPFAEQHRIVAKVDELMALCGQLKTRITQSNQLQQKLADVVVEQAIA